MRRKHDLLPLYGSLQSDVLKIAVLPAMLKDLYRQGWLQAGLSEAACDSIADHSYAVALLSLMLGSGYFPELDLARVIRIALVHDIGEALIGDITPADGVTPEEKRTREREAVVRLLSPLPDAQSIIGYWEEYESGTTPEGMFVRQIDKLEVCIQARLYAKQQPIDLDGFFRSNAALVTDERLKAVVDALASL